MPADQHELMPTAGRVGHEAVALSDRASRCGGREADWRERVGDAAYQQAIAAWEDLLGDHAPYPHAVYPADNPQHLRTSLREDEAWWRQALGDRYDEVLAHRTQLDHPDGG